MGTHEPEYRLVQHIPPEKWDVYQSADGPLYIEPVSAKGPPSTTWWRTGNIPPGGGLIGNYGFWMLAAGFVVGLLIFFNQLDVPEERARTRGQDPGNRGRGGAVDAWRNHPGQFRGVD